MLFNSIDYIIFFPITVFLYYRLRHEKRWILLLAASCLFYMAFIPPYILVLFTTIIIDYFAGIFIEDSTGKKQRLWLWVSILSTCGVLFIFKYFNFFDANLVWLGHKFGWHVSSVTWNLILPIGLSFHTFQSLSYVVEVYYGRQKSERHFGKYALYVMFFPQLVSGPIERPQNLLRQIHDEKHELDLDNITQGLKLMVWGMFKKVVVADRLAIYVDYVYKNPHDFKGQSLILATLFFAFQIYYDFSGYTDIARGSARVLGFRLMKNFNRPYAADSFQELWRRWHISLSTWFRDYVYIPLGGNRKGTPRWIANIYVTFLLSGLWHGASWTYVFWGALHGTYLIVERATHKIFGWGGVAGWLIVFVMTCEAWIFFRASHLSEALYILRHQMVGLEQKIVLVPNFTKFDFWLSLAGIAVVELVEYGRQREQVDGLWQRLPEWGRLLGYVMGILLIINLGSVVPEPFIYFQF